MSVYTIRIIDDGNCIDEKSFSSSLELDFGDRLDSNSNYSVWAESIKDLLYRSFGTKQEILRNVSKVVISDGDNSLEWPITENDDRLIVSHPNLECSQFDIN